MSLGSEPPSEGSTTGAAPWVRASEAAAKRAEKMSKAAADAAEEGETAETAMAFSDRDYRRVVPDRYANPETSGLSVEITSGMEAFTLELTADK